MGNPTEIGIAIDRAVAVLRAAYQLVAAKGRYNIDARYNQFESAVKGE